MFKFKKEKLLQYLNNTFDELYDSKSLLMHEGHNGPYLEKESPLRASSHWLIILSKMAEYPQYQDIAIKRIGNLHKGIKTFHDDRQHNFISRISEDVNVDAVNGTIGAAWVFEGLSYSLELCPDAYLYKTARKIYSNHKFNSKKGLWHRCLPNGDIGRIDQTFNHQLWFSYGSARLFKNDTEVINDVKNFIKNLDKNMGIYNSGLIYHPIPFKADIRSKLSLIAKTVIKLMKIPLEDCSPKLLDINYETDMYRKSIGYHCFNLFALSGLKKIFPSNKIFSNHKIEKVIEFIFSDEFLRGLDLENYFGYRYNLTGLECLYVQSSFKDKFISSDTANIDRIIKRQLELLNHFEGSSGAEHSFDKNTYVASFYKALV